MARPEKLRLATRVAGVHPNLRIWHIDWLSVKDLHPALRRILPTLSGRLLDVGCGTKPYEPWCSGVSEYVGVDISPSSKADFVVVPFQPWPFEDLSFDSVFTSQALEHVRDFAHVLCEVKRVLKPGGKLVVSVPFYHNEHGAPDDYRRFSQHGMREIFGEDYEISEMLILGGVGSVRGVAWLNFVGISIERRRWLRKLRSSLWPLWHLYCGLIGAWASLCDKFDSTGAFYTNVILVATKK